MIININHHIEENDKKLDIFIESINKKLNLDKNKEKEEKKKK